METPLARDERGNPFELPDGAAFWRVRRITTGRPRTVLGPDGEPLYIPIDAGTTVLEDYGCEPGRYRLEATDGERRPMPDVGVGFVELGGAIEPTTHTEIVPTFLEPPRTGTEALTRAIEASQRTQLERERQYAERERWQMHAMVESQRSIALICTSLIERLKPATSPAATDPLTILKQQAEANKVIDQLVARRNGGAAPATAAPSVQEKEDMGPVMNFVSAALAPIAPAVNQYIHAQTLKMMGLSPEQIAAQLAPDVGVRNAAAPAGSVDGAVAVNYPRSLRQVLGELSDEEARVLDEIFFARSENERQALFAEADKIEDLTERVEWTRSLIRQQGTIPGQPPFACSVPPAFVPLFQKLTPAEQATAARILSRLDLATLNALGAALMALAPDEQLAKVRQMIEVFMERETSTVHRAVVSVLGRQS